MIFYQYSIFETACCKIIICTKMHSIVRENISYTLLSFCTPSIPHKYCQSLALYSCLSSTPTLCCTESNFVHTYYIIRQSNRSYLLKAEKKFGCKRLKLVIMQSIIVIRRIITNRHNPHLYAHA